MSWPEAINFALGWAFLAAAVMSGPILIWIIMGRLDKS